MNSFLLSAAVLTAAVAGAAEEEKTVSVFESSADVTPQGKIDELVFAKIPTL